MPPADPRGQLKAAFNSTLQWINERLAETEAQPDVLFLRTLKKYVTQSLRLLSEARSRRDIAHLQRRADKAQSAALFYVQRSLPGRRIDER